MKYYLYSGNKIKNQININDMRENRTGSFILLKKLFLALIIVPSFLNAQDIDSLWFIQSYRKIEQYIPMRDGTKLFTAIYVPKDTLESHPVLIWRTPYSCRPYGEDKYHALWNGYKKAYLQEKYIIVYQDVRGKWMSEGQFVHLRPLIPEKKPGDIDESTDAYDTIDWLIKNIRNNNGRVGVYGISYPGFFTTMAAASNHPALVAVSPQAPAINWFIGDDFHHNGAFFMMDAFSFFTLHGKPRPYPTKIPPVGFDYYSHDNYKFYLETGPLPNLTKLLGDSIAFWKDLMAHPDYDSWWKERDVRITTKNVKPASLWVGGLFDAEDRWGAWNGYLAAEKNNPGKEFNKIVMGPWDHGQWASRDGSRLGNVQFGSNTAEWYQQNIEIPFFNYYLKGKGDISRMAEATIFLTGANEWKNFSQWPPSGKKDMELYLNVNGSLTWTKPSDLKALSRYLSDPSKPVPYTEDVHFRRTTEYMTDDQRFASRRPDVLVFQTEILNEDITVTGCVMADLMTSISTTDADFVVKLIDVFPDNLSYMDINIYSYNKPSYSYPMGGYQMLVMGEIFRGRYRKSFEKPEAFIPGKIEKVRYAMGDVAHTFKKGHRIMIQIQSSWFPLADRNPQKFINIYQAKESDFQKAFITIYHNQNESSMIILPVLSE